MSFKSKATAVLVFAAVATPFYCYFDREEFTVTVRDKERVDGRYLIYTDKGTFRNTDSWLFLKFSSADMQGKLGVGETFRIKANGWRIPILSKFQNIITAEKVDAVPAPSNK